MNEYWNAISPGHKDKVRNLAEKNGVSIEQVLRNLLKQLEWEMAEKEGSGKFEEMVTIRQIEQIIDDINL